MDANYNKDFKRKSDGRQIGVVGMGDVGISTAFSLNKNFPVLWFDINSAHIQLLKQSVDDENAGKQNFSHTEEIKLIKECDFIIITVPTMLNERKKADLCKVISASKMIGN